MQAHFFERKARPTHTQCWLVQSVWLSFSQYVIEVSQSFIALITFCTVALKTDIEQIR